MSTRGTSGFSIRTETATAVRGTSGGIYEETATPSGAGGTGLTRPTPEGTTRTEMTSGTVGGLGGFVGLYVEGATPGPPPIGVTPFPFTNLRRGLVSSLVIPNLRARFPKPAIAPPPAGPGPGTTPFPYTNLRRALVPNPVIRNLQARLPKPARAPAPIPPLSPTFYAVPPALRRAKYNIPRNIILPRPRASLLTRTTSFGLPPIPFFGSVSREALARGNPKAVFNTLARLVIPDGTSQVNFGPLIRSTLASIPPDPGPIPVFPTLPQGFPIKVDVVLDTIIGTTKSLREVRVAMQQWPIWDMEIRFEELRDQTQNQTPYNRFPGYTEYQRLVQHWMMMYGQAGVFAFDCPWDNSRANQLIGVGDGTTYVYTIVRTWGTGPLATVAPIGMVNVLTEVDVAGVPVNNQHYILGRNKITFINVATNIPEPPAPGANITMTLSYYYVCRFVADEQDFEEFSKNRYTVPSLKFRAVIWPP